MAITTLAALKSFLGVSTTTDDAILTSSLSRAESFLARKTGRIFDASTSGSTRYFDRDAVAYGDRRTLLVDEDLLSVTTLVNGDGTTIAGSDYRLLPYNSVPAYGITLLSDAGGWTWDTDGRVAVTGVWGYSTTSTVTDDTVQAALNMAAYYYRMRDAQVFPVTAQPDGGQLAIPPGTPRIVADFIRDLRKSTY